MPDCAIAATVEWILSLVALSALALVAGALVLFRRGTAAKQAWLMLVLAAVMIVNVLIWTLPTP